MCDVGLSSQAIPAPREARRAQTSCAHTAVHLLVRSQQPTSTVCASNLGKSRSRLLLDFFHGLSQHFQSFGFAYVRKHSRYMAEASASGMDAASNPVPPQTAPFANGANGDQQQHNLPHQRWSK